MTNTKPEADTAADAAERFKSRADFDAILSRYGATVLRYAWRLAGDRSDAEELVQETFMTLWKKRRFLDIEGDTVLPWLLVTCRNHGANLYRRSRKHEAADLAAHPDFTSRAVNEAGEELEWVLAEIATMTPLDQAICKLCLIDGVSYREAAAQLKVSTAAVAKRVERARRRLKTIRSESD
ncbi:MAG: hypothetical protein JWQ12_1805 [Glaciihabitans sp.]|nr:hypothetical protein [Glaciihabitans sp.]